ncbi:hypothetical protein HPP92_001428 [Vanilla planifolia]|uniref:Uncharacterized protein n=1 Tax=Vanilla planifolia TaxID=51239 RepID=A0A835S3B9_VANPL|nr:hypothetical protein HPP92_001428 [Vanilla planifolia]
MKNQGEGIRGEIGVIEKKLEEKRRNGGIIGGIGGRLIEGGKQRGGIGEGGGGIEVIEEEIEKLKEKLEEKLEMKLNEELEELKEKELE